MFDVEWVREPYQMVAPTRDTTQASSATPAIRGTGRNQEVTHWITAAIASSGIAR